MVSIANLRPKKVNGFTKNFLEENGSICILAEATSTIIDTCQSNLTFHLPYGWGLRFTPHVSVLVAGLPRPNLFFIPLFSKSQRHMQPNSNQSAQDLLRQLLETAKRNEQQVSQLVTTICDPDPRYTVKFDRPFTFKTVFYAN